MKLLVLLVVGLVFAAAGVRGSMTPEEELEFLRLKVRETYPHMSEAKADEFAHVLLKIAQEESFLPIFHDNDHYLDGKNESQVQSFTCAVHPPSTTVPTEASKLRPGDIKVLGALGDSLTAAFGAKASTIFTLFNDFRGVSYATGGDDTISTVVTLGSILEQYNRGIKGLSTGKGNADSTGAGLNLAVTGAIIQDLASQVNNLINKMKSTTNFQDDWKMVSILIGHNNLCDYCDDANANGPETFGRLLEASIDILYQQVPRIFINLLAPVDVTALYEASSGFCSLLHAYECSCAVKKDANIRKAVSEAQAGYVAQINRIVGLEKYKGRKDFAVVLQPFLSKMGIPKKADGTPDTSYLAPDCFHFSAKAHKAAAVGLWNNIFEVEKRTSWVPGEPIVCPSANEYLVV